MAFTPRLRRRPPSALVVLFILALAPLAGAHVPASPKTWCQTWYWDDLREHDYVASSQAVATHVDAVEASAGVAFNVVTLNGNVSDCDPYAEGFQHHDGEWEFGVGGAFLPTWHHQSTTFRVVDDVHGEGVAYYVGIDGDGDGVVAPAVSDPYAPDCLVGPLSGTADISSHPDYYATYPDGSTYPCYPSGATALVPGYWVLIPPLVPGYAPPVAGHVYN